MAPTKVPKNYSAKPFTSLSLTALATLFAHQPLFAQEDTRATAIEEIIVTARKTEESIQETPISIAAFGTDALEKIGAFDAGAVSAYTPNLQIRKQTGSQDNFGYSIRGVSSGETSLAVEPTVGLYMDGVYIARSTGAAFDIVDLERIEVLRGPQGTLFGRNTIGGAINVISEKPSGEFGFKQLVSVGNRDYVRSQTTIDTPAFGDVSFKFSHMYNEKGGTHTSIYTGNELGQQDSQAFRIAARWTPNSDMTIDYTYDKSDRENNANIDQLSHVRPFQAGLGGAIYAQASAAASTNRIGQLYSANDDDSESTSDIDGHALTVEWDVNDSMTFKSITSYREWKSTANGTDFGSFPSDGTTVLDGAGGFVPMGDLVSLFTAKRRSAQHQFTQEFQFVGDAFDENMQYNFGLYYFEERADENNPQRLVLPASFAYSGLMVSAVDSPTVGTNVFTASFLCGDAFGAGNIDTTGDGNANFATACVSKDVVLNNPTFVYTTDNQSLAAYGEFAWAFTDQLEVTLGLRYTIDDKGTTLLTGSVNADEDDSWNNFSPSINVSYQVNDEINTYFKISNGYRAGGYNARSTTLASFQDAVDEETIISYEAGIKSDWFDRTLRFNAALFFFEYEDQQIAQFEAGSGGASSKIVNAGNSETLGFEMDVTWLPVTGLMIMANYGYLDPEFEEYITPLVDPVTGLTDTAGGNVDIADIAYAEKTHSGALIVEYQFEPMDIGELSIRVDSVWADDRSFHPQLNLYDTAEAYNLLNARATLANIPAGKDGRLKVSAWGKNLGNEKYREWGIDFGSLGFAINTYGELRSYGIDVVYEFNR